VAATARPITEGARRGQGPHPPRNPRHRHPALRGPCAQKHQPAKRSVLDRAAPAIPAMPVPPTLWTAPAP